MSVVYFISDTSGLVKIGHTSDLKKRLCQITSGNGGVVVVLGTVEGGPRHERALHGLLADHRVKGEWFRDGPDLRRLLDRVVARGFEGIELEPEKTLSEEPALIEAVELASIILNASGIKSPSREFGESLGLRSGLLWELKYRFTRIKDVSVSDYLSLIEAAKTATDERVNDLLKMQAYARRLKRQWDKAERDFARSERRFEKFQELWEAAHPGQDFWESLWARNAQESAALVAETNAGELK